MCLIAFNWDPTADTPLLLLANRDEFHARPAAALAWWDDGKVLAGRDLRAGGGWLGVNRAGRLAALTNYRDPSRSKPDALSRGGLVSGFLQGNESAADYIARLRAEADRYNDFNLLLYDGRRLLGYESRFDCVVRFGSGVHAVSNARFDTPWPKLEKLKAGLRQEMSRAHAAAELDKALFQLLLDPSLAADEHLPRTGVPLEWERLLSAAFIRSADYGTRAASLVRVSRQGLSFTERRFEQGEPTGETSLQILLS
ncbi:NRDE family protein [Chitinimonas arctica]|nr:NRDE family protein [Chitinimonas arctica]